MSENISRTKHRFADVKDEPCTFLAPISGYNEKPLVTLEEATKPLLKIVKSITKFVNSAKKIAADPPDGLSDDQSAAIVLYTMEWSEYSDSLYYILNTTLRAKERQNLKPWFLYLKLLCTALTLLPSVSVTVYRGINYRNSDDYRKYLKEKETVWWGFSSCSMRQDVSEKEQFTGATDKKILFIIDCITGKDISKHSYFKEDEVLLLPATTVERVGYKVHQDGTHIIHLKEIEPSISSLEPPCTDEELKALKNTPTPPKTGSIPPKIESTPRTSIPEPNKRRNRRLEEHIVGLKSNSEVFFTGKCYTPDDIEIIVQQVVIQRQCSALFLRDCEVTSQGVAILARVLHNNTTLKRLFMSNNKIGDEGAKALAIALADNNNETLEQLNLSYNNITDVGIEYLAAMLESNTKLTHLYLASNKITDKGLQRLAAALINKNQTLQSLALEWNRIRDDATSEIFTQMLDSNESLRTLNLNSCGLSRKASKVLKDAAKSKTNFELIVD